MNKNQRRRPKQKKVEIDIDRNDINKADLKSSAKRGKTVCDKSKDNDPSWYNHFPQLLKDAATVAFSYPTGTKILRNNPAASGVTTYYSMESVAGIAVLGYLPTIGKAGGSSADPINVSANSNYTMVRRNVSTYANYDAPDLMQFFIAMDSAYMVYAKLVRIYGLMQATNVYNRYLPRAIVNALGFSYDSLLANLADFRALINAYAYKLAQFCIPSDMDYFKRHIWMEQNVFTDAASTKAQMYVFNAVGFYYYNEVADGPAQLIYKRFSDYANAASGLIEFSSIANILNDAILPLMESQDCMAMSGDVLRAYGADHIYTMAPIAENYLTIPAYSAEVLSQFENAVPVGEVIVDDNNNPNIVQQIEIDFGGVGLKQTPVFAVGNSRVNSTAIFTGRALQGNLILNAHKSDVTPEDVAVMTRLTTGVATINTGSTDNNAYVTLTSYGSEIATSLKFYSFQTTGSKWQSSLEDNCYAAYALDQGNPTANMLSSMARKAKLWAEFDWCPNIRFALYSAANNAVSVYDMIDVDNWTVLSEKDLMQINEAVMLSLFDNPMINTLSKKPI